MRIRRLVILGMVGALLLAAAPTPAQAGERSKTFRTRVLRLINDLRTDRGLRPLQLNLDLSRYAWDHSVSMSRQRRLYHSSDLRTRLRRYSASRWGENVGVAGTARYVVRLWMRSTSHRANLLERRFRKTGIGIVKRGGRFWVTQIAYG